MIRTTQATATPIAQYGRLWLSKRWPAWLDAAGSTITVLGEGEGTWKDCDGTEGGGDLLVCAEVTEEGDLLDWGEVTEEGDSVDLNKMRPIRYSDHRRGKTNASLKYLRDYRLSYG